MNRSYQDIIDRAGDPLWYDEQGVPRYEAFSPDLSDIYANYVAYLKIHCQSCDREFFGTAIRTLNHVGTIEMPTPPPRPLFQLGNVEEITTDPWAFMGSFNYGDPPHHGCGGDHMGSVPKEIVQFWALENEQWVRVSTLEFVIPTFERSFE